MKIPVQEKIAELEQRIAALEKDATEHFGTSYEYFAVDQNGLQYHDAFGEHWDKMWGEFHLVMRSVFGRFSRGTHPRAARPTGKGAA